MKSLLKYFKGYLWETFLGPVFKLFLEAILNVCPLNHRPLSRSGHSEKGNERSGDDGRCFVFLFASFGVVVAITAQYFFF